MLKARKVAQKEIKKFNAFDVIDVTMWKAEDLYKIGTVETVMYSTGTYGLNGLVVRDNEGNYYKVTKRASVLFVLY